MSSPWVNPREAKYWGEKAFSKTPGWHSGHRGGMAIDFYVPTALERIDRFFTYLANGGLAKIGNLACAQMAQVVRGAVAARYRELAGAQTRSPIGKLSFEKGKDTGEVNPARLPRSDVSGYTQLASAIQTKALGGNTHSVHIDGSQTHMDAKKAPFTSGVPLRLLAFWIENSTPTLLPVTLRMAVYLRMLREGRGGYKAAGFMNTSGRRAHLPDKFTGKYIVVVRPSRPVWSWVVARMMSHGAQTQVTGYVKRQIEIVKGRYRL